MPTIVSGDHEDIILIVVLASLALSWCFYRWRRARSRKGDKHRARLDSLRRSGA